MTLHYYNYQRYLNPPFYHRIPVFFSYKVYNRKKKKTTEFGKQFHLFFVIIYLVTGDEYKNDFY